MPSRFGERPLGLAEVRVTGGFWGRLQDTNAAATLAHCESWMERLGWLANFDRVADGTTGADRPGWSFSDSEAYKLLEALCWEYGRCGDPGVDTAVRRLTARVGRAQDPDGYLNTCYGHAGQPPRYHDLEGGHELYCTGHLLQAAVARLRTTGVDELVEIARRAADHVCDTFAGGGLCGHPEIEVGLAELGRALGEERYLEQARIFLDRRGHHTLRDIPLGRAYFQDDVPIRAATAWRGHAVRALYLAAGSVDVAVERDDRELLAALERQWEHTVARRTYLTGGMGSRHQDESFGDDWELPADRAYSETCAAVASIMVAWRLYLATGQVRYADLIERTFYNVVATSPRADGRAFFYANPLHQRVAGPASQSASEDSAPDEDAVSPRANGGTRAAWFNVSCCPTNLARTLATWHLYAATVGERTLTLLQYATGRITTRLGDGRTVGVEVVTGYPHDGLVTVRVLAPPPGPMRLRLRVPPWAHGAELDDAGRRRPVTPGFAVVERELAAGDQIRLRLPVAPRFTWPDHRVDAVRGCVAVERGPLVLCAESLDLPDGASLDEVVVDPAVPPVEHDGRVLVRGRLLGEDPPGWPYDAETHAPGAGPAITLPLLPYHRWAERGPSAMRIWLPALPARS